MSTQDQITEILNAMDRNPELAEQLRARILGDDLMAEMEEGQNERVQIAELLETVVELSGTLARFIAAVDSRQRKSDEAIAELQHGQDAMQSAIANMQIDIERMAASQSRMDEAIAQLQTGVKALTSDVASLKSDMAQVKGHLDKVDERFDGVDERFDGVDERFDKVDERFDRMDERLDRMDDRFDRMDDRFDRMDDRLDRMDDRFDRMDDRFDKVEGRLDNAAGANYEFKVQKNLGSIAGQHLRLRRIRTLKGPRADDDQDLRNRADESEDNGIITESENHDMWLLDLIFSGRRRDDGKEVLVAAEISITAGDDDISRAKTRAETLSKATDTDTIPVVFAENINQERRQVAKQEGVVIIPVSES